MRYTKFLRVVLFFLPIVMLIMACSQPYFNEKLKQILIKEAGLDFKDKLNIKKFESSQSVGADYFEIYEIELSPDQSKQALAVIKAETRMNWIKIERGYTFSPPARPSDVTEGSEMYYTFTLDTTNNFLEIQIAQE